MNLSVARSASPAFNNPDSPGPHADGSAILGVYKPTSNPVHAATVAEGTAYRAPDATDSPVSAIAAGTALAKPADPADMFRTALGPAFTVTERGALIDVAHQGRLAVRIAAAEVTPELVAHHRRWLSAVSL